MTRAPCPTAELVIELPLPPTGLMGNAPYKKFTTGNLRKQAKENAAMCFRACGRFYDWIPAKEADVTITWYLRKGGHQPDRDNALRGLKSYFDALNNRAWVDDRGVRCQPIEFERDPKRPQGAVVLTVRVRVESMGAPYRGGEER